MAGHSQFKNIMHRKGRQDAARAKLFAKLAREITVSAKTGLPDPEMNARLRLAIQAARAENMPKDNIERAIKKASGADTESYEAIRYEGYGPGGVALIVEVLTDNRNRSASNVRAAFTKAGGALGETGSVSFMWDRAGLGQVAAGLGEIGAHVGSGTVAVVGQRLDDQRHAAGAIALVADLVVVLAVRARCLLDGAVDIVLGHVLDPGGDDGGAQAGIHVRIGQAHLRGHGDFAGKLGKELRALRILLALAVHDVGVLGMTGHGVLFGIWSGARRSPIDCGAAYTQEWGI